MTKHLIFRRLHLALPVLAALIAPPAAAQTGSANGAAPPVPEERILPGDIVRLTVWREEDLSGDFPVNQFGLVVLPLVGEYDVSSETQWSLREKVTRDLRESRYNPSIELVVLRRVRVVGEVNEPGVFPLDPTMTVADAVAMARGRTQFAQEGHVMLRRGGAVVDADLRTDERIASSQIRSGDEIVVPRRSWLDRNAAAVIGGASALVGIIITLIAR